MKTEFLAAFPLTLSHSKSSIIAMKRSISALACFVWVLSTTTVGAGQSKPNQAGAPRPSFSGKWILDIPNSKLARERKPLKIKAITLWISHEGPALTLTETTDYEGLAVTETTTLYTDRRGEKNQSSIAAGVVKSKTRWDGSQLITKISTDMVVPSSEGREGPSLSSTYNGVGGVGRDSVDNSSPNFITVMVLQTRHFTTTVKRELSADGQTLTIGTFQGSSRNPVVKQVFKRAA